MEQVPVEVTTRSFLRAAFSRKTPEIRKHLGLDLGVRVFYKLSSFPRPKYGPEKSFLLYKKGFV